MKMNVIDIIQCKWHNNEVENNLVFMKEIRLHLKEMFLQTCSLSVCKYLEKKC